jgi:hypothetical protein
MADIQNVANALYGPKLLSKLHAAPRLNPHGVVRRAIEIKQDNLFNYRPIKQATPVRRVSP